MKIQEAIDQLEATGIRAAKAIQESDQRTAVLTRRVDHQLAELETKLEELKRKLELLGQLGQENHQKLKTRVDGLGDWARRENSNLYGLLKANSELLQELRNGSPREPGDRGREPTAATDSTQPRAPQALYGLSEATPAARAPQEPDPIVWQKWEGYSLEFKSQAVCQFLVRSPLGSVLAQFAFEPDAIAWIQGRISPAERARHPALFDPPLTKEEAKNLEGVLEALRPSRPNPLVECWIERLGGKPLGGRE